MKKIKLYILFLFTGITITTFSQNKNPYIDNSEEYTKVITGRAAKIINELGIEDSSKYYRVLSIIVEQYRNISATHDFKDALIKKQKEQDSPYKESKIIAVKDSTYAALRILHAHFIAGLATELGPEQIEKVKEGMTYGRFQRDLNVFYDMIPELTDEQKRYIYTAMYEARELAMDEGSSKNKHKVFDKYRGRINNYLSAEGYDLKQKRIEWEERLKKEKEQNK